MLKKINIIIIFFFGILTVNLNLGFSLILPLIIFYFLKDFKNIYYIYPSSLLACFIFSRTHFLNYLILLIITVLFYFLITKLCNKYQHFSKYITLYISIYLICSNLLWAYIFKNGPLLTNNVFHLGVILTSIMSVLIYIYVERYLYKMLLETYDSLNIIPTSLCYLEIFIAILATIGGTTVTLFNVNCGFILGVYFSMYFGRSYKNIFSILYSIIIMLILLVAFKIEESIFIPFIGALYFINSIYLIVILNIFLTTLIFIKSIYSTNSILAIMAVSVIFEIIGYYIIKPRPTSQNIFEDIHDQVQKNATNEILNFATFLDKFAIGFKNPKEFNEQLSSGIKAIVQNQCKTCIKMKECFNKYKVELYPIFKSILLEQVDPASESMINKIKEFYDYCTKTSSIEKTSKLMKKEVETNINANNNALIAQITGVSSTIRKYVVDLTSKQEMSYYQLLLIKKRLLDYGYEVSYFEVKRYFQDDFLILVGIKNQTFEQIEETVNLIVEKTINCKVSIVKQNEERFTIYFNIIPNLKIDILYGYGAISCEGLDICGDNYLIKEFDNGHFISAISDGMGKGYSAFYESDMTLKLVSEIIESNLDSQTALEILNTYYVVQDYLERYATLDFLEINRYNSLAHFYKLGATTTYIFKENGTIDRIINKSLPFGIEEEIDNSTYTLDNNDLILMSSDGIFENLLDSFKLETFINEIKDYPPQKIVYEILNYAINNEVKTKDDMSVIALKIKKVA